MPWRVGIMAALLAWLLLASPAGAAIQRYTDSRGVIHISNGPAAKAAAGHQGSLAEKPGPEMASLPESAASPARAEAPAPRPADSNTPQTLETSPPAVGQKPDAGEKSQPALDAADQVGQAPAAIATNPPAQGIIGMIAAAATAAAKTVTPAVATAAAKTVTPAAAEPLITAAAESATEELAEAEASPAPAPQAAAPKAAEMVTVVGIRRYQDAQGVWHITNVEPEATGAGPGWQEAKKTHSSERSTPEKPTNEAATVAASLPLQKVSWTQDYPDLATLATSKTKVTTAAPESVNVIRRYRDSKGVIHIDNVEPGTAESLPAGVQVRAGPEEGTGPPVRRFPSPVDGSAPLALKRVAWSGEEGLKLLKPLKAGSSPNAVITTEGGIKRWRDKKGVWHIETVEYPLPPGVVLPPRLGGPNPVTLAAKASTPTAAAPVPPGVSPASTMSYAPPRVPTITAFRDARGRLKITNDAPVNLGKPPLAGAAPAPAELEPLIVEAAQVHRLPATLIRAVIKTESNFCSWAVSPKGAMGLMQLMPGTAAFLGVAEPFNPRENLHGGCRYLRLLIDLFGGNVPLALAAYNAGYQRVIDCGFQVPPIKETQDFVTMVMGRYVAEEHRAGLPWT